MIIIYALTLALLSPTAVLANAETNEVTRTCKNIDRHFQDDILKIQIKNSRVIGFQHNDGDEWTNISECKMRGRTLVCQGGRFVAEVDSDFNVRIIEGNGFGKDNDFDNANVIKFDCSED